MYFTGGPSVPSPYVKIKNSHCGIKSTNHAPGLEERLKFSIACNGSVRNVSLSDEREYPNVTRKIIVAILLHAMVKKTVGILVEHLPSNLASKTARIFNDAPNEFLSFSLLKMVVSRNSIRTKVLSHHPALFSPLLSVRFHNECPQVSGPSSRNLV